MIVGMAACPRCGEQNPDRARLCMMCGTPLGAHAAERRERRVVSVLFADLVGFTSRSEALDIEDVDAFLAPYHDRLRRDVERFGGVVCKFTGDGLMAIFGAPVAHEDDPERAVRAALAIRSGVQASAAADEPARRLHVRLGVTTGEVLVSFGSGGELDATGDVVNTAARLESAAPADGVLVDEFTYRATDRAIVFESAEAVVAKGKSAPVKAWRVVETRSILPEQTRIEDLPLVGRHAELGLLTAALERSRTQPATELVTLTGAPGIGKTRLVQELAGVVDNVPELIRWRQGRSLPYGEGVAFWALGEIVKSEAGILDSDPAADAEEKLARAVGAVVISDVDRDWIIRWLRPLVGLEGERDGGGDGRVEAFAAWRRFLEALAEDGPTVLVFEDIHWADDALLDFIDLLADRAGAVPLLIVCTSRPELLERRPAWGGGKINAHTIGLNPLSAEDTGRLVGELLDQALLPAETQQALLDRAEGNPLYAQEYVRMLKDRGLLVRGGHGWTLTGEAHGLPESVQGIIAARLDTLSAEEKALVHDASVVGRTAWLGAVAAIEGRAVWELEELLHGLERKQLLLRSRRSSVAGQIEFSFAHSLTHEVAYSQIRRMDRAAKHEAAARWIEGLSGQRDDKAELFAYHYLAALELRRQAGEPTDELASAATGALIEAGRQADAVSAYASAVRHFHAALDLMADSDSRRPDLLLSLVRARHSAGEPDEHLLLAAREANVAAGSWEGAALCSYLLGSWAEDVIGDGERGERHYKEGLAFTGRIPYRPVSSLIPYALVFRYFQTERLAAALDLANEAIARADQAGDLAGRGLLLNMRGLLRAALGDPEGIKDSEESPRLLAQVAHPRTAVAYNNLAEQYIALGQIDKIEAVLAEVDQWTDRFSEAYFVKFAAVARAFLQYNQGDWDGAIRRLEPLIDDPYRIIDGVARTVRGWICIARDDLGTAKNDAQRAIEFGIEGQNIEFRIAGTGMLLVVLRRHDGRPAVLEQLRAFSRELNSGVSTASVLAELAAVFQGDDERDVLRPVTERIPSFSAWREAIIATLDQRHGDAATLYRAIGCRPLEAAAHLLAAEQFGRHGNAVEAARHAEQAAAFYRSVGASHYLARADPLRRATA
jgi:class 3 adenylate cyclase/tetratricopeptide (TPR) repeat protein/energy-coupling factor transporter ATP-binding protein EcfA2